jgi:stage IV sporulation protein FB
VNLIEPNRTPWDLQFYVGNIPCRVHPMFWVIALMVGGLGSVTGVSLIIGVLIVFVSILVHELGHAFTMQFYGERPRVVLYWMGGLAISGGDGLWDLGYSQRRRSPLEQIIISFAGPAAGFILAGFVIATIYAMGGAVSVSLTRYLPQLIIDPPPDISLVAYIALHTLLFINVVWGLVNLLPVYPLDGGQIARQVFQVVDRYDGLAKSLWVSVIVGAGMAVLGMANKSLWTAALFGSMAFSSWQMLQNGGRGGRPW